MSLSFPAKFLFNAGRIFLGAAIGVTMMSFAPGFDSDAHAGKYSHKHAARSGVILGKSVSRTKIRKRPVISRSAGVSKITRYKRRHHKHHGRKFVKVYRSPLAERRRLIEKRNHSIRTHELLERQLRRGGKAPVVNTDDPRFFDSDGTIIYYGQSQSVCPASHNCGYRLYDNGLGPRIITIGTPTGSDLPGFDGLNGPKIITIR